MPVTYRFIFILFSLLAISSVSAQEKESRILIILDGSSTMLQEWRDGEQRFKVAGDIIVTLIDSAYRINGDIEFGLRVFGHQYAAGRNSCYNTKQEVRFTKDNYTQMALRLDAIQPSGVSPVAYSLKQAATNDLIKTDLYNYAVVLITDGGESCRGNICEAANKLLNKLSYKPYVISLIDSIPLQKEYECFGNYLQVTNRSDIPEAVNTVLSSYRKMLLTSNARVRRKPAPVRVIESPRSVSNPVPQRPTVTPSKEKHSYAEVNQANSLSNTPSAKEENVSKVQAPAIVQSEPQPSSNAGTGIVHFTNTNNLGKAELYRLKDGRFLYFQTMNISGNPNEQRQSLEADQYEVRYTGNNGEQVTKQFTIKNDAITSIRLE